MPTWFITGTDTEIGKISKQDFYERARFYKKGDLDPESPRSKNFYFRADCYNIPVSDLT